MKTPIIIGIIVAVYVLINISTYMVDEREQAVLVQLGKPIKTVTEPGLKFKLPFPIQQVRMFDDRLLEYDADPEQIYTQDKKNLVVDNYARWRIIDPLKFMQRVGNEHGAQSRLDDIVYSVLREELGKHTLSEVVSKNREQLMRKVTVRCDSASRELGVTIADVRIKRADLPPENEKSVFNRMRAERSRKAKLYRSEGEEEALKIRAQTDKEKEVIMAEAYRQSQMLRGDGDARALKIYADAFQQDPDFYEFMRTLEAMEQAIDDQTAIVLSADSDFFRYLKKKPKP